MDLFLQFVKKESRILDYGCGYGRTLSELLNNGYVNLYGVDISVSMINRGKEKCPGLDLSVINSERTFFKESFFDAVILFGVLTCIPSDKEQKSLISEIKRILKPEGIVYINDFLINSDKRNVLRYEEAKGEDYPYGVFFQEKALFRHHSKDWIASLTSLFKKESYKEQAFKTMNNHVGNGFCYIGRKTD